MSETVQTKATSTYLSVALPLNNLEQTFTYDGSGNVETISVSYQAITYTQTFTWAGGNCTNISQFEPPA